MSAIAEALLAVVAAGQGDVLTAEGHLARAHQHARSTARRDRQLVEIAALVVAGQHGRAAGLGLVHTAEFPDDLILLAQIAEPAR